MAAWNVWHATTKTANTPPVETSWRHLEAPSDLPQNGLPEGWEAVSGTWRHTTGVSVGITDIPNTNRFVVRYNEGRISDALTSLREAFALASATVQALADPRPPTEIVLTRSKLRSMRDADGMPEGCGHNRIPGPHQPGFRLKILGRLVTAGGTRLLLSSATAHGHGIYWTYEHGQIGDKQCLRVCPSADVAFTTTVYSLSMAWIAAQEDRAKEYPRRAEAEKDIPQLSLDLHDHADKAANSLSRMVIAAASKRGPETMEQETARLGRTQSWARRVLADTLAEEPMRDLLALQPPVPPPTTTVTRATPHR